MFNELKKEIFVNNNRGFEKFCDVSVKLLNKHAPIKKKYKRGNQMPVVTKGLSKTVMKRSKLMQTECYTKSIETTAYTF